MPWNRFTLRQKAWRLVALAAMYPLMVWLNIWWLESGLVKAIVFAALTLLWGWYGPRLLEPLFRRTSLQASSYGHPSTRSTGSDRMQPLSDVIAAVAHRESPRP